jgi:hypothetical protein
MSDNDKALVDAVLYGNGFIKDGKHIPIEDVYLDPRDATIQAQATEIDWLRAVLELADAALRGANVNMNVLERKIAKALAGKAEQ